MTDACRTTNFPSREAARTISRRARLSSQIDTKLEFCDTCEAWHLCTADQRIDALNVQILRSLALGLRDKEISKDLGITEQTVHHRVVSMMQALKAISRANLVATAIWLKAIDLQPLMPQFEKPTSLLRSASGGYSDE